MRQMRTMAMQVKLEEPDYDESIIDPPMVPMMCDDQAEEFNYDELEDNLVKVEVENEPVPSSATVPAPPIIEVRYAPTESEAEAIFDLLERGFTLPMFLQLVEKHAGQKKQKESSRDEPGGAKKQTKRKSAPTPKTPFQQVLRPLPPLPETAPVALPSGPAPKKSCQQTPVEFPDKTCDWDRVEEARKLIIRRCMSKTSVVKGTGVVYKKVSDWIDQRSNDLTTSDGHRIINWYLQIDKCPVFSDRMHPSGRKYIDKVFIERGYAHKPMSVEESIELTEQTTEAIKAALGDLYTEDDSAKAALVRDMVRKKRSRAMAKEKKEAEKKLQMAKESK